MRVLRLEMAPVWLLSMILIMGGVWWSVASAADNLPSSPAPGAFSPWKKMHPSTFDLSVDAVWEQCERTRTTETWLTPKQCTLLTEKLEAKQCKEVMVPDGTKLDRLLGRVNGGTGKSMPWAKQEKQTGRLDRALLCDLGSGVHSYWFTGQKGKSCNNVAFVYLPPAKPVVITPLPAPVVPPVVKKPEPILEPLPTPLPPPPPSGQWVCVQVPVGEALQSPVGHHHEGFVLRNECCCDENPLVVRSHNFHLGSTVQSAGYAEQCYFQPN
jgi:hypothetical protein